MDQLISQVTQRTGISEQQAREVLEVVSTFLKSRLPAPLAVQVDGVLSGQGQQEIQEQAQELLGKLGGMFGQK